MNVERPILYSYFLNAASMLYSNYTLSREQESSRNLGNNREYFNVKNNNAPILTLTISVGTVRKAVISSVKKLAQTYI